MSATMTQQAIMAAFLSPVDGSSDRITASPGWIQGLSPSPPAVAATGTPSGNITIGSAVWVIPGPAPTTQGPFIWTPGTTGSTVAVPNGDATNPRIDLLTLQVTDPGTTTTPGNADFVVVPGTAAASPSAPSLPSGAVYIATISRNAGDTTVSSGQINASGMPTTSLRTRASISRGTLSGGDVIVTSPTSMTTTETNVNGLSAVTVNAGSGSRRAMIAVSLSIYSTVANDEIRIRVYDKGVLSIDAYQTLPAVANRATPVHVWTTQSGFTGTHTLRVTVVRSTGSGTINVQGTDWGGLHVEDVGV